MNQNQNNQDEELLKNWKEQIDLVCVPSDTTFSGLEVVYDPEALKKFIHSLLQAVRREERERAVRIIQELKKDVFAPEPIKTAINCNFQSAQFKILNNQSND